SRRGASSEREADTAVAAARTDARNFRRFTMTPQFSSHIYGRIYDCPIRVTITHDRGNYNSLTTPNTRTMRRHRYLSRIEYMRAFRTLYHNHPDGRGLGGIRRAERSYRCLAYNLKASDEGAL